MFNKINSTFGQRTGPHCNQELENQKAINCFPVAEKGNKSKGLFKGEEIRQLYCLTVTVYGLELQLQIIILKGVLPEGWIQAELSQVPAEEARTARAGPSAAAAAAAAGHC